MANLNPVSQIREYLHDTLNTSKHYQHLDFAFFEALLNKPPPVQEYILRYLDWCNERESIKVIKTQVPSNIVACSVACFLNDIKVQPMRHKTEDDIYIKNQDIREKVSRGNCIFELDENSTRYHCVIRGFKKFTGGLGDEDDYSECASNSTWEKFFLKPIDEASSVIALRKINGEAAHFSARWFNGEVALFAGSKNVHIVFKNMEDINKYCGQRYDVARKVAENVLHLLESIGKTKAEQMLNFFHYTRLTAVMEMLCPDTMHVENLSHLSRCELHFLAWMDNDITEHTFCESLCGLPPRLGIEIASALGFKSFATYETLAPDKVDNKIQQIRKNYGYEGEVLYYLDAHQAVFGIIKKKTTWYILLRAIREKGKLMISKMHKSPQQLSHYNNLWKNRIEDIQKWLHLENAIALKWKKLGMQFLKWIYQEFHLGKLSRRQLEDTFPVEWKKFLEVSGCTDKFD